MNIKKVHFIKNILYSISSNIISLLISALVTLFIPKLLGIEDYGYWQLYLFYSSYVGFFTFGWNDGIFLRYGGDEYADLSKEVFHSQFIQQLLLQIFIGLGLGIGVNYSAINYGKRYILLAVIITMIFTNLRIMLLYVLQATNRIKEYANVVMLDRIIYISIIILFLLFGVRHFELIIIAEIIGKLISLYLAMVLCKDICFKSLRKFSLTIEETIINIKVGIKLMFSNVAGSLILGIVRYGIERTWSVIIFGKLSLSLSISNMLMIFVNAIGITMFPILRRMNPEDANKIYQSVRNVLMVIFLGSLIFYYPLKSILGIWLPKYKQDLLYMSLIFPIFVFEGRMTLLLNTYLKTLRQEKLLLKINLITMTISIISTYITTKIFINLYSAILCIVPLIALRAFIAEYYLSKIIAINYKKDIFLEVLLTALFMASGWFINSWHTFGIYFVTYLFYLCIKRKELAVSINDIKKILA